jgi:hypothetical protein
MIEVPGDYINKTDWFLWPVDLFTPSHDTNADEVTSLFERKGVKTKTKLTATRNVSEGIPEIRGV